MTERAGYHHGNLRAALISAASEIIAEKGVGELSVAETAKRTGVSSGAPYRHFPSKQALLAAVVTEAAAEFDAAARAALSPQDADEIRPAEAMAAVADTYVRFVVRRRIGWDVLFGGELADVDDDEKNAATRALSDTFLRPALAVGGGDMRSALTLLEHVIAAAHGYAELYIAGLFARTHPDVDRAAAQAAAIARALVTAQK